MDADYHIKKNLVCLKLIICIRFKKATTIMILSEERDYKRHKT